MKFNRTLAVTLALASFTLRAYAAENAASLNQLTSEAPAAAVTAPLPVQPAPAAVTREVTAQYKAFYDSAEARFDGEATAKLNDYKVILVPGFLSDVDPNQFHLSFMAPPAKRYFEDQIAMLKSLGITHERLVLKSQSSVQVNAVIISAAIKASDKPVILIGHSKGGLDILETLRADRSLLAKVRGVITLQSPFYGSPVAEYVNTHSLLTDQAVSLLLSMGGNKESMENLTVTGRKQYMADNAAAIAEITAAVPVISLTTFKDPVHHKWDTNMKPFRDEMYEHGIQSDGLVPVDSAILPGADFVKLDGLDHGVTIRPSKTIELDRVRFTKALLLTLFAK